MLSDATAVSNECSASGADVTTAPTTTTETLCVVETPVGDIGVSSPPPAPQRHAVDIGANGYADEGIADMKYAEPDAGVVYAMLTGLAVGRLPKANVEPTASATRSISDSKSTAGTGKSVF